LTSRPVGDLHALNGLFGREALGGKTAGHEKPEGDE